MTSRIVYACCQLKTTNQRGRTSTREDSTNNETAATVSDLLQPLHFVDAGDFAQAGHDLFQVFEVGDIEDDFHAGLAVFGASANVADIALSISNYTRNAFQHPEAVVTVDGELDRVSRGRVF